MNYLLKHIVEGLRTDYCAVVSQIGFIHRRTRYGMGRLGEGKLGQGQLGVPSSPPKDITNEDLKELYEELYDKAEEQREELQEIKEDRREAEERAKKFRRRSWIWRVGTFIAGLIIGLLPSIIF